MLIKELLSEMLFFYLIFFIFFDYLVVFRIIYDRYFLIVKRINFVLVELFKIIGLSVFYLSLILIVLYLTYDP